MPNDILVVFEHEDGKIRRGSFEALALARRLASELGGRPIAAIAGAGVDALAREIAARGADVVHVLDSPLLAPYTPDAYRAAVRALVESVAPEWVLMAHSYQAQDYLPLVSAAFGAPVISDAVDVAVEDRQVVFLRQPYDAKFVARTVDAGPAPHFATLQSGAFSADALPEGHGGTTAPFVVRIDPAQARRKVVEVRSAGDQAIDLSSADVIVAGGRGLGTKEKFDHLVGSLAHALGAALGASRPVVDSGWLPHEHQIGSSGQAVAPRLYIAVGISGAIQHVVGMRGSQVIVAVNKDKDAPIFNEATYGLIGDLNEIVPALIHALGEARA